MKMLEKEVKIKDILWIIWIAILLSIFTFLRVLTEKDRITLNSNYWKCTQYNEIIKYENKTKIIIPECIEYKKN